VSDAADPAFSVDQLTGLARFAHHLADLADAITLPGFVDRFAPGAQGGDVERKADGTAVTAFDRDSERAIRAAVAERFPGHAFLGEEDGLVGDPDAPRWIVDPIDGTTNFVTGNPVWATSIALQVDGVEEVGVVSAPALGSRWDGVRGGVAHQDGRVIRVSDTATLADAQVTFGGLAYFGDQQLEGAVTALTAATRRQRGFGDFWQHCLVAAGACDIAVEAEVNLWDLAAVKVVVEAAGGRFTDLDGRVTADGGSAIATNGRLHDEVLRVVAEARPT
jgi:histidinol-phosphatase